MVRTKLNSGEPEENPTIVLSKDVGATRPSERKTVPTVPYTPPPSNEEINKRFLELEKPPSSIVLFLKMMCKGLGISTTLVTVMAVSGSLGVYLLRTQHKAGQASAFHQAWKMYMELHNDPGPDDEFRVWIWNKYEESKGSTRREVLFEKSDAGIMEEEKQSSALVKPQVEVVSEDTLDDPVWEWVFDKDLILRPITPETVVDLEEF